MIAFRERKSLDFSEVIDKVIGTFLHLLLTPCIPGESTTEVQLDSTSLGLDSTCPVLHDDGPLVTFWMAVNTVMV